MKSIFIDFSKYPTKKELMHYLMIEIEGMYGLNYDAFIDALTFYQFPLQLELLNIRNYENDKELIEILDIIGKENPKIKIKYL